MSRHTRESTPALGLALACAGTVWVTTWSWREFTEAAAASLVPLAGLAVVVALTGAAGRRLQLPGVVVFAVQALFGGMLTCLILTGSLLPLGDAAGELSRSFELAIDTSMSFAAPVPASAPGIHPLLIPGGLACLLLVDLLACTLRRVPLAGLPLLAIYSVPVSVLGTGMSWWIFALTAGGFLLMLFIAENESITRWGRSLQRQGVDSGLGVRTGAARGGAFAVGATATALAVVVPLALPTLDLEVFDVGAGPGGNGEINVENPMVDLRRDLRRENDIPLIRLRTNDPDPSYLRISVLTNFTDAEWTSGDRSVPVDNVPGGQLLPIQGLSREVARSSFDYDIAVLDAFRSTWLPTPAPVSRVDAEGDWRWDDTTLDFISASDDLDTAGLEYRATAVEPELQASELAEARDPRNDVSPRYLELPDDLPPIVTDLALQQTSTGASAFEKAVLLQQFFRRNFVYDLERADSGNGLDELAAFLSPEGRVGYCEQFAASMAVMARELGIPARVAVGFLTPAQLEDDLYEYSSYDLHAWPELYFPGAGWTRFEPTPSARANNVPAYTRQQVQPAAPPTLPEGQPGADQPRDQQRPEPEPTPEPESGAAGDAGPGSVLRLALLGGSVALAVLVGLGFLPGVVRRRRRERRLAGGPEDCWAELHDTALDLGIAWPVGRSPRQTRDVLAARLSHQALADLDRLVAELEHRRYARRHEDADVSAVTRRCLESLEERTELAGQRRARWVPVTVLRPRRSAGSRRDEPDDTDETGAEQPGVLEQMR